MVNFWVDIRIQPHSSRRKGSEAKPLANPAGAIKPEKQESYLGDKLP
jgi:hypothetical protein